MIIRLKNNEEDEVHRFDWAEIEARSFDVIKYKNKYYQFSYTSLKSELVFYECKFQDIDNVSQ